MLTFIISTIGIITTIPFLKKKNLWPTLLTQTSTLFLLSRRIISKKILSSNLLKDNIKTPLIILRFWLIPVSLLARIGKLQKKRLNNKKIFSILIIAILIALIITFSASKLIILFIGFESALIPTLFLIIRWGTQQERTEAGYFFIFYTLATSLPLLLALITIYNKEKHLSIPLFKFIKQKKKKNTLTLFCILAFLVKVPIFGLHLWLPKAHVEAPVAGSMILAAILLKLGGYGFIRLVSIFTIKFNFSIAKILIPFCCWGGALTSLICLTQTDLKSLIAYSSVSHMSFMIAGISPLKNWGITGGIIVMIAHGLVSSALFCIANTVYERTGTRNLSVSRGIKKIFLILPSLWLILTAANLGLPPLPKAIGELFTFTRIITKRVFKFIPTLLGIILTRIFRLTIFQQIKRGTLFKWNLIKTFINEREYITLSLHLTPLIFLVFQPKILSA